MLSYLRPIYIAIILTIMLITMKINAFSQTPASNDTSSLAVGDITTVVGIPPVGDGLPARSVVLGLGVFGGGGLAVDSAGNLFLADSKNHRVRRIDAKTSIITTVAGNGIEAFNGDGGLATKASLDTPLVIALDEAGNLFISDSENHRIRRVDAQTGIITTVVGNGQAGFRGDGGKAIDAVIRLPLGLAVDRSGNLFFSDDGRVRRVDAQTGIISTVAGGGPFTPTPIPIDGRQATSVYLSTRGITVDNSNNLYICDVLRIDKVNLNTGIISTVIGTTIAGSTGDGGPASNARLDRVSSVNIDREGNFYVADETSNRIRRVDAVSKIITTFAGNGLEGYEGDNGLAKEAKLLRPEQVATDPNGNVFIADGSNHIRRVDKTTGIITTIAGTVRGVFGGDGVTGLGNSLIEPAKLIIDSKGNFIFAETGNQRIRQVDGTTGIITTIAGQGKNGFGGDGGNPTAAQLSSPNAIDMDFLGNIYIADSQNNRIRMIDVSKNIITTIAGTGFLGFNGDNQLATKATVDTPRDILVDSVGNLYIADTDNSRIRVIDAKTKKITTIVGTSSPGYNGDGIPAKMAQISHPTGIFLDADGSLFIADTDNNRVRKVDATTGLISTIAGTGVSFGANGDGGLATMAVVGFPSSITVDEQGNVFIAERGNNRIRRIDKLSGIITTVAGNGKSSTDIIFNADGDEGPAINASLNFPTRVVIDKEGNLLVSDTDNGLIRLVKGVAAKPTPIVVSNASFSKNTLLISGSGLDAQNISININGQDFSKSISERTTSSLTLKGSKKKLNLKKGTNTIILRKSLLISVTFELNL